MEALKAQQRDAIVFVPGLGRDLVDQRIETVARKLAGALDRQAVRPELKFPVVGAPEEEYGQSCRARVSTVGVQEPGSDAARPLVDLYELDYHDNLTGRFKERNPLSKVLIMLAAMLAVAPRFLLSLGRKGKGLKDQLQMLVMAVIMFSVAAYIGILLTAGGITVAQTPALGQELTHRLQQFSDFMMLNRENVDRGAQSSDKVVTPGLAEDLHAEGTAAPSDAKLNPIQALVLILTTLGLFNRRALKEAVAIISTEYVCASNYLRLANRKPAVLGQAAALLEHLAEKKRPYRQVHVVSYSFGTLVALDLLFPHVQPGARLGTVKTLVTIGCPLDLVRTYWPGYFEERNRLQGVPARWINLYAPLDVFGSNFRDDSQAAVAEQGITSHGEEADVIVPTGNCVYDVGLQAGQVGLLDILLIKGLRIHSSYWTEDEGPEVSCFDQVALAIYGDDPLLKDGAGSGAGRGRPLTDS